MGKNSVENARRRLDRLTQLEAQMAVAQLLSVANLLGSRIGGVADDVLVVNDRVLGVDDRDRKSVV